MRQLLIPCPLLIFMQRFTFGGRKNWGNIKKFQHNMTMLVCKNLLHFFVALLTTPTVKNSHIFANIYFILLKYCPRPNSKVLKPTFAPQWKDPKKSYQVRQRLAVFLQLSHCYFRLKLLKGLELPKMSNTLNLNGSRVS